MNYSFEAYQLISAISKLVFLLSILTDLNYTMTNNEKNTGVENQPSYLAIASFIGLSGLSLAAGFTYKILSVKKTHALSLAQAFHHNRDIHEPPIRFVTRAFGIATIITTSSLGAISLLIWYIMKPTGRVDFNQRMRNIFPSKWRTKPSPKSEIQTFDELYAFLINNSVTKK
ncbi:unnamed protein product [Heterobilharzia americana]|nr:unnamed protein product [Heterobilharzia americana]CAH8492341.1 unnamed protein product [Heterobilharzia americana]